MKKAKIAVDVDLVCTSTVDYNWYNYLVGNYSKYMSDENYETFCKDVEEREVEYNLTKYFDLPDRVDKMAYWKQVGLYDKEYLAEGCYQVVKNLWEAGFEIYFLSNAMFGNIGSKHEFLKRNFDFLHENNDLHFVPSKSKCCMDGAASVVIDDRKSNLNMFKNEETLRILFDTRYKQDVECVQDYKVAKDWYDVENEICKWMEL